MNWTFYFHPLLIQLRNARVLSWLPADMDGTVYKNKKAASPTSLFTLANFFKRVDRSTRYFPIVGKELLWIKEDHDDMAMEG